MLDGRTRIGVFKTVTCRLDDGKKGPPDSFSEEEKKLYLEYEKEIERNRKAGVIANYSFPNDYDWSDDDFDYAACNR